MNGTDLANPLTYDGSNPNTITVAGFTKYEHMAIEFTKALLPTHHLIDSVKLAMQTAN